MQAQYNILENPSLEVLNQVGSEKNALIYFDSLCPAGALLTGYIADNVVWGDKIHSHQYQSRELNKINEFYLEKGSSKIFVGAGRDKLSIRRTRKLITEAIEVLTNYSLHKGWFGAETQLKSVKCMYGHPLEVIGRGMNEGNDWFTFGGLMDNGYLDEFFFRFNRGNYLTGIWLKLID